jgi:hypothetical protein
MTRLRSKAEERFGQKPDLGLKQGLDVAERVRADKTTKLRQLRLAKEAEDAAEKQAAKDIKAAGKSAFKKPRRARSG